MVHSKVVLRLFLQKELLASGIRIIMNLYVHTTEEEKLKEIELVADALKVV